MNIVDYGVWALDCGLVLVGSGLVLIASIALSAKKKAGNLLDKEALESLNMPRHEWLARHLATRSGAPEFEWRKFTPIAVSMILQSEGT